MSSSEPHPHHRSCNKQAKETDFFFFGKPFAAYLSFLKRHFYVVMEHDPNSDQQ